VGLDSIVQAAQASFQMPAILGEQRKNGALIGVEGVQTPSGSRASIKNVTAIALFLADPGYAAAMIRWLISWLTSSSLPALSMLTSRLLWRT
jgi:hypothetical protein